MIISDHGAVAGKLDENTLDLSDVRSARLQQLIDDWREHGFDEPAPAEIPADYPGPRPTCAMTFITIPFDKQSLGLIENKLLIAGFDVQPD